MAAPWPSLLLVLVTLLACGRPAATNASSDSPHASAVQSPAQRYAIATSDHSGPVLAAETAGLLSAQTNDDKTACTWIGGGSNRTALIWPPGYSGAGSPLEIVDQNGRIVAVEGKVVVVGGGQLSTPLTVNIIGCHGITQAWAVGAVLTPSR